MAYKIIRSQKNSFQSGREVMAVLDSEADLTSLSANEGELSPGSIAIIATTGLPSYMLNVSGEWKRADGEAPDSSTNPNSVVTYTGTVATIMTANNISVDTLANEIMKNEANAFMSISGLSVIGLDDTCMLYSSHAVIGASTMSAVQFDYTLLGMEMALDAVYTGGTFEGNDVGGELAQCNAMTSTSTGVRSVLSEVGGLPCTFVIVKHPLTGALEEAERRTY